MKTVHYGLCLILACLSLNFLSAQQLEFQSALGLVSPFAKDNPVTIVMPIEAGFSLAFNDKILVGARLGHSVTQAERFFSNRGDDAPAKWNNHTTTASLRLGVYSGVYKKWEPYGGINFNVGFTRLDFLEGDLERIAQTHDIQEKNTTFFFGAHLGTRCLLNDWVRLYAEAGTGISLAKLGVSVKL